MYELNISNCNIGEIGIGVLNEALKNTKDIRIRSLNLSGLVRNTASRIEKCSMTLEVIVFLGEKAEMVLKTGSKEIPTNTRTDDLETQWKDKLDDAVENFFLKDNNLNTPERKFVANIIPPSQIKFEPPKDEERKKRRPKCFHISLVGEKILSEAKETNYWTKKYIRKQLKKEIKQTTYEFVKKFANGGVENESKLGIEVHVNMMSLKLGKIYIIDPKVTESSKELILIEEPRFHMHGRRARGESKTRKRSRSRSRPRRRKSRSRKTEPQNPISPKRKSTYDKNASEIAKEVGDYETKTPEVVFEYVLDTLSNSTTLQKNLENLDISENELGQGSLKSLKTIISKYSALRSLHIQRTGIEKQQGYKKEIAEKVSKEESKIQCMSFGCWSIHSGASTIKVTGGSENDIDWDDTKIILGILQHNDSIKHLNMKTITPENADTEHELWTQFKGMLDVNKCLHSINLSDSQFDCLEGLASIYFSKNKSLKWITNKNMAMGGRISQGHFIVDNEWTVMHSLLLDRLLESDGDLKSFTIARTNAKKLNVFERRLEDHIKFSEDAKDTGKGKFDAIQYKELLILGALEKCDSNRGKNSNNRLRIACHTVNEIDCEIPSGHLDISNYNSNRSGGKRIIHVDQLALLMSGCRFACLTETTNCITSISIGVKAAERAKDLRVVALHEAGQKKDVLKVTKSFFSTLHGNQNLHRSLEILKLPRLELSYRRKETFCFLQTQLASALANFLRCSNALKKIDLSCVIKVADSTKENVSHGELLYYDIFSALCHKEGEILDLDVDRATLRSDNIRHNNKSIEVLFAENATNKIVWPDYKKFLKPLILSYDFQRNQSKESTKKFEKWESVLNEKWQYGLHLSKMSRVTNQLKPFVVCIDKRVENLYFNWKNRRDEAKTMSSDDAWYLDEEKNIWYGKDIDKNESKDIYEIQWSNKTMKTLSQLTYGEDTKVIVSCKEPLAVALSTWHGVENFVLSEILEDLASEVLLSELYTKAVASKKDAIIEVNNCYKTAREGVLPLYESLFSNKTKIWSYYEIFEHENRRFHLTEKGKIIEEEAESCEIEFDASFSGITLSVQNEKEELKKVEAVIKNMRELKKKFEREKKFASTPGNYYEDYNKAIAKMKNKVEEIFFAPIVDSTENHTSLSPKTNATSNQEKLSPWETYKKELSQNQASQWLQVGVDPPSTYPIDTIQTKLKESENLIGILEEIQAMREAAIDLAERKKSEYKNESLKEFNVDCKTFRDNLNIVKEMLGKDNRIEKYIGNSVSTKSFLNGGMDEKWKKLEDKNKDLRELSTNLGLYIKDDYQIFRSLDEIVEDVKKRKEMRQRKNKDKLDKIGVRIEKERDKKLNVKTEDLERLKGELEIEGEIYEILNGKVTEKKLEYKDKIKAIERNLENAATLLQ